MTSHTIAPSTMLLPLCVVNGQQSTQRSTQCITFYHHAFLLIIYFRYFLLFSPERKCTLYALKVQYTLYTIHFIYNTHYIQYTLYTTHNIQYKHAQIPPPNPQTNTPLLPARLGWQYQPHVPSVAVPISTHRSTWQDPGRLSVPPLLPKMPGPL